MIKSVPSSPPPPTFIADNILPSGKAGITNIPSVQVTTPHRMHATRQAHGSMHPLNLQPQAQPLRSDPN